MIDITTAILAIEPNASFICKSNSYDKIKWLSSTVRKPSIEEVIAKIKELQNAEPLILLREERDKKLAETDWWTLRASDGVAMTQEQKDYRQALRDLPSTASPQLDENGQLSNVTWPTKPE